MMKSIQAAGEIIKPIDVRRVGDSYEIEDGEVRWLSAIALKIDIVPINVMDIDHDTSAIDTLMLGMSATREELNPGEVVSNLEALYREFGVNAGEIVAENMHRLKEYCTSAPELRDRIVALLNNCGINAEIQR